MISNTERLVELIRQNLSHYEIKLAREQEILGVLGRVDRRMFIPQGIMAIVYISQEMISLFLDSYNKIESDREKVTKMLGKPAPPLHDALHILIEDRNISMQNTAALMKGTKIIEMPFDAIAYNDMVVQIGYNQTCSQPSITCIMMDSLDLHEGMNVLEIGSGCGYSAAICSELVGENGKVTTVERIPQLAELAEANLRRHFGDDYGRRIEVVHADGSKGYAKNALYDRIYLTAGMEDAKTFDKGTFVRQLKPDSVFVYPEVEGGLFAERYKAGAIQGEPINICPVLFVPLVEGLEERKS